VVVLLSFAAGVFVSVALLLEGTTEGRVVAALTLLILGGVGAIVFPVRYRITNDELVVHSGVWTIRVPLHTIERVAPSRSVLSSPALSLDRIAVQYRKSRFSRPEILISPVRRHEFLEELAGAAGLEARDDAWVRPERDGTMEPGTPRR
jgi:hypothetical protein